MPERISNQPLKSPPPSPRSVSANLDWNCLGRARAHAHARVRDSVHRIDSTIAFDRLRCLRRLGYSSNRVRRFRCRSAISSLIPCSTSETRNALTMSRRSDRETRIDLDPTPIHCGPTRIRHDLIPIHRDWIPIHCDRIQTHCDRTLTDPGIGSCYCPACPYSDLPRRSVPSRLWRRPVWGLRSSRHPSSLLDPARSWHSPSAPRSRRSPDARLPLRRG